MEEVPHDRRYGNLRALPVTKQEVFDAYFEIELGHRDTTQLMRFLRSSLDEDQFVTIRRWLGYHLVSNTLPNAEKFVYLWGSGANGKSQLLWLIRGLVGKEACAELRLDDLRISANLEKLVGALAMLGSEATTRTDYEVLKGLTSRDPLTCNPKYRDPFVVRPECLVTQASNRPPEFRETSDAFARRVISIEMRRSFKSADVRVDDIAHRIVADEYPTLVGLAFWGALEISEAGRFVVPESVAHMSEEVAVAANQIEEFGKLLEFGEYEIAHEELMQVYLRWCTDTANIRPSLSARELLLEVERYAKAKKHIVVQPKSTVTHYMPSLWHDENRNVKHVRPLLQSRKRVSILRGVRVRADVFYDAPIGQPIPAQRRLA